MRTSFARAALASLLLSACGDSVTEPPPPVEGTITVDASAAWTYVNLETGATVTPSPSARESSAWDIGFFATSVSLNGGAAGPAGVMGSCLCQNAAATNDEVLAMTDVSELAEYEAVSSVGSSATFSADALVPALSAWYTGTGAAAVADPAKVFLVRLSNGSSFAKVHVTNIQGASATSAGSVTLEYAVQATSADAFGATKTITLTSASTSADLKTDALISTGNTWDVRLEGWNLVLNGGVSGSGSAAAADGGETFATTTTAVTAPQAYRTDGFGGVFSASPWYRYNILGDNRISPTFNVYFVKRGTSVYKIQIINYYSSTGTARHITFRYKRIAT
jgi:hypothetical protein